LSAELDALLQSHRDVRVERPPVLWRVAADEVSVRRLLDAMVAEASTRAGRPSGVVVNVSNVTVEPDPDPEATMPTGDMVAVSVLGPGDWGAELLWRPDGSDRPVLVSAGLDAAAIGAGALYAYTRSGPDGGSVTVFLPREP
jgi:hypothetical protein